jgi:superfamily II DNA or RNA helicase
MSPTQKEYDELFEKYHNILIENEALRTEISQLRSSIPFNAPQIIPDISFSEIPYSSITKKSDSKQKIDLFLSIFRGRTDVYAQRWQNIDGKSGYSPVCLNEWKNGLCLKPAAKCSICNNKSYKALDENVIAAHLMGKAVAGVYPLFPDETCGFLAIDFDGEGWEKDISTLREICDNFNIPLAVERSRSGNGAHAWFFFIDNIASATARKFGSALLTCAMNKRHSITFKSYDRLFPNQDTMPKGGFGNLIALPLQKEARKNQNSEFIDQNFTAYPDQWAFLGGIQKLSSLSVEKFTEKLCRGNELGPLKCTVEEHILPWETINITALSRNEFPEHISIIKADMLYIPENSISSKALNYLKRLAAFKNPEFYKAQAMRMSTYNKPRIISCSEEKNQYLCLPRGCKDDLDKLFTDLKIPVNYIDNTNSGRSINIEFTGVLRKEQSESLDTLLENETGVLCATTAFGKTVVAIGLIAARKVNTLILVDRTSLVAQWKKRLHDFLTINEKISWNIKQKSVNKVQDIVGQIGSGKDTANGIIDIALIQSLNRCGEIKDCVKNYGMIIVDECHHVSAFSFEQVLKTATAKYVYGLTATPIRKDGHHPIIFMQCGSIRYKDDVLEQTLKRPFDHFVIPRFTSLKSPLSKDDINLSINDLYNEIVTNESRNQMITADVISCFESGRNCLVLTERTEHAYKLANALKEKLPGVMVLTGSMKRAERLSIIEQIAQMPYERQIILVATGRYIGEGFDEPRLDTLFLTMPISWKGTLQQYAGRLHRLHDKKYEVQIFDYIDISVKMLEKMYQKRLNGYASIGYKVKGSGVAAESIDFIFDNSSFQPVYKNDLMSAAREILIVSPFVRKRRVSQVIEIFKNNSNIKVKIITRPPCDFKAEDQHSLTDALNMIKNAGFEILYKNNIHQKFAIIDESIVWYGSINLLSFGNAEESIMRLESAQIAAELIKSLGTFG